jgi:hypothetical protein
LIDGFHYFSCKKIDFCRHRHDVRIRHRTAVS